MQEEVKENCDHISTMIYFEQLSKQEVKSSSTSTLFIKAPRIVIDSRIEVLNAHIASYEANILLKSTI